MHAIHKGMLVLAAGLLCAGSARVAGQTLSAANSLVLTENNNSIVIKTPLYQAELDKSKGFTLKEMNVPGRARVRSAGIVLYEESEREKYNGQWFGTSTTYAQSDAKVDCKILSRGPMQAKLLLSWKYPVGAVEDIITFDANDRLIKHNVKFDYIKNMSHVSFGLKSNDLSSSEGESVFYPDAKRVTGVWNTGVCVPTPAYRFAYNPVRKVGFGLASGTSEDLSHLHYFMRGTKEGWSGDLTNIELRSKSLRWTKLPGSINLNFAVIAGGNPADAAACAVNMPVSKPVTLDRVWPKKVIYRLGEAASTEVVVSSHSNTEEQITLVSTVTAGVGETREVDRRNLTLHPKETVRLTIPWNSGQREYGLAFKTEILKNGKVIDWSEEYTSITNFAPKVAQIGIMNPGNAWQEGSESAFIRNFRDNYFGIVEYYCWAPDQVTNLTPQTETWHPHTESQGAYEATLSKSFLKTLAKEANENGVLPYAMVTGLMSLYSGLDNPELFQYTRDGQPYLFNGNIYDKKRRYSVGPANAYNPDTVRQWAEQMADSVDMFGWQGCRWDWGFIPNVPADPLGLDSTKKDKFNPDEIIWYDHKKRSARELFTTPDATGAHLLRIWRETVNKRHPNYVYGTNFCGAADVEQRIPKYFKEASTNSLVLFEYLLECNQERYNTWQKWARHLTEDCQRVRVNGGQPCVGFMRGLGSGVTLRMAQYLIFASGVHWSGGAGARNSLDDTWKRFRFALRFSEYYYDPGFLLLPPERRGEVDVKADPRVFWNQFVYERKTAQSRDVTVHLLNLPDGDYIVEHHKEPAPKKDITVQVSLKPGEKVKSASVMLPDPAPHAVNLKWDVKGGTASIKVPVLETAAIVLVRIGR